jgi:hypothetical protein
VRRVAHKALLVFQQMLARRAITVGGFHDGLQLARGVVAGQRREVVFGARSAGAG